MDKWTNPKINSKELWYKNEAENNHHLMPSSRADNIQPQAQIILFESFHNSRHRVFGNWTPIEQIFKVLSVNTPIIKERFKNELIDMMKNENYVYRNGLWTRKK